MKSTKTQIESLKTDNHRLRTLLWMHHGCPIIALYGYDGEMQCSQCMIDFKRDSIEQITRKFIQNLNPKLSEILETLKNE